MRALAWTCVILVAACGEVNTTNPDAAADAPTIDTATVDTPTIDADTTDARVIDAEIDAVPTDAFMCTPNMFQSCSGNTAIACNATGTALTMTDCGNPGCNATAGRCNMCIPNNSICANSTTVATCGPDGLPGGTETCALSCNPTPTAHCRYVQPIYLPDACDARATMPTFSASAASLDTNLDAICNGGIMTQLAGPAICVIRARAITIGPGAVTVTGGRALALISDDTLSVTGLLDASATTSPASVVNGPGGGTQIVSTGAPGSTQGGGGGGGLTNGGAAGNQTATGGGPAGGGSYDPALFNSLVGGMRAQSATLVGGTVGGGGGGAITLISCRGTVAITGVVDVGGGGGVGGRPNSIVANSFISGTGGGGGGYAVLQGLNVSIASGSFFANGGGGGSGMLSATPMVNGANGQDGSRSDTTAATGGASPGPAAGAGGAGSVGTTAPRPGVFGSGTAGPGGGGGAAGRIQIYTPMGVLPTGTPTAVSPRLEINRTVPTR